VSYELLYTDKAIGQLDRLPEGTSDGVEFHLRRLADAPVTLSVRIASPPFPPRGQLFHFTATDDTGRPWFFTIIFRYSQDEATLRLLSVTWRELDG
jgi:hypothetical protein